ncbi:MAG TPA: 16S rRNA (guanine(966)-N(2))-methyltransferase RsmD [Planctomycetota bacterium]|nr:16S rRNA (guanine(966)-N(2))-methyltransferase RsmD [Planctomycetota bacterium]
MRESGNKSRYISNGVKIISGFYKGTNLFSPVGVDIRPALARMKNSLFNILAGQIEGQDVLDLFAGTGSLGFEALSRGARRCFFIDNQRACIDAIQKSIGKLRLEKQAQVILMDSFNIVSYTLKSEERFNYIFVDPPYRYYDAGPEREKLFGVISQVAENNILAKGGMIIVEHRSNKIDEDALNMVGQLKRVDLRNYGQTSLSFLKRKKLTTDSTDFAD